MSLPIVARVVERFKVAKEFTSPGALKPKSETSREASDADIIAKISLIARVSARAKAAQDTSFVMSDLTGEPGGKKIFWPRISGFDENDVEGQRHGLTAVVEYTSKSDDLQVHTEFTVEGDGDTGGSWETVIQGKVVKGRWEGPEDISKILKDNTSEALKMREKVKDDLEALKGSQWTMEYDDVDLIYSLKDSDNSATVTFLMPVATVLGNTSEEDFRVFYGTDDWDESKNGHYSSLQDMKRALDNAAKWFQKLEKDGR